jgi:hypothetical protein
MEVVTDTGSLLLHGLELFKIIMITLKKVHNNGEVLPM